MLKNPLNLLVLSDLHIGEMTDHQHLGNNLGCEVNLDLTVPPVIAALNKLSLEVDCIVAPGDLTSRGYPVEFASSSSILKEFAIKLGVEHENILITFGNHDVDWRICDLKLHAESEGKNGLDQGYEFLAGNVGGLLTNGYGNWNGPIPGCGRKIIKGVEIYALNSGFNCYSKEVKHGKVSTDQMLWFQKELESSEHKGAKILVIHHHLWDMRYPTQFHDISKAEPAPEIIDLLGKHSVTTVIHGHRHHPCLKTHKDADHPHPITHICAGSFGVGAEHRERGILPNTFHHIYLEPTEGGHSVGKITTFQKRISDWEPLNNSDSHLDHIQWFGDAVDQDQKTYALNTIEATAKSELSHSPHYALPIRSDLPMCLRVIRDEELNTLMLSHLQQHYSDHCGGYPDKLILIK